MTENIIIFIDFFIILWYNYSYKMGVTPRLYRKVEMQFGKCKRPLLRGRKREEFNST